MKRIISLLLALALCLGLAACTASTTNEPNTDQTAATQPEQTESNASQTTDSAPTDEDDAEPETVAEPSDDYYPVTISNYDYAGNVVEYTYEKAPERVICVYQGCIELMIALGLEDHVIASYGLDNEVKDEWKAGFEKMHYDDSVFAPDKETVTMLEPDMIFSWTSYFSEKKLGDVYGWHDKGVATYIAGNSGAAPDRTLAAVEGQDSVTVAVVEPLGGSISNYGAKSLAGDMVTQLGGTLVKPEGNEMGKEDLVTLDPDVIFVVYMAYSGDDPETVMANQLAVIQDDPALASLSAVANNRVHLIMLGDMYASGPRTIDGIRTFAQGMYPDLLS